VTVNFDIRPRQAMAPSDFKALGRSIRRWLRLHAKQQGSVHWYDNDSLAELLRGRPPLAVPTGEDRAVSTASIGAGSIGGGVSGVAMLEQVEAPPPICLSLVYNKIIDDRQIFANVRRALSPELVADVLVNGQSWDDPAQTEAGRRPR
jgi:hypothetical protein